MKRDRPTLAEISGLMDLEVQVDPTGLFSNFEATSVISASGTKAFLVPVVDAEGELVCYAPADKAPIIAKILNCSEDLVDFGDDS